MQCKHCRADNPEVARYCWQCGQPVGRAAAGAARGGRAYSIQPGENVGQLALISTLLPATNRGAADDYRWALSGGFALTLLLTAVGLLPAAVVVAAFLLPVTYLVYMHDVNLWENRAGSAVLWAFLVP